MATPHIHKDNIWPKATVFKIFLFSLDTGQRNRSESCSQGKSLPLIQSSRQVDPCACGCGPPGPAGGEAVSMGAPRSLAPGTPGNARSQKTGVHSNSRPSGPSSSSQIRILMKSCKGSSRPTPLASLPHPLPLPSPHPLSSSHPGSGCCSNTPGSFLAASAQGLLITECSPDPLSLLKSCHSLTSLHSSPSAIGFSPVFTVCQPLRKHIILLYFVYSWFPTPRNMPSREKSTNIW